MNEVLFGSPCAHHLWPLLIERYSPGCRLCERPDVFDPERFVPERAAARPRFSYLPFGAGPRICIGAAFAMAEAMLILASSSLRRVAAPSRAGNCRSAGICTPVARKGPPFRSAKRKAGLDQRAAPAIRRGGRRSRRTMPSVGMPVSIKCCGGGAWTMPRSQPQSLFRRRSLNRPKLHVDGPS
jgi:hypothetical protein